MRIGTEQVFTLFHYSVKQEEIKIIMKRVWLFCFIALNSVLFLTLKSMIEKFFGYTDGIFRSYYMKLSLIDETLNIKNKVLEVY